MIVIAGPNGSGKTSVTQKFLPFCAYFLFPPYIHPSTPHALPEES